MYDRPQSPNEGACLRHMLNRNRQMRGPVLRYMLNRNRPTRGRVASPNDGACLRYILNRLRQMRGVFKIYVEPESPVASEGPVFYLEPTSPNEGLQILLSAKSQGGEVTSDSKHFCRDVLQIPVSEKSQVSQNRSHKWAASRARLEKPQVRQNRSHK